MSEKSFYFDPSARGIEVFLGPTEAILMKLVWRQKELTVKKALYYLSEDNRLAYTTVMTVMARLAEKGFLTREKDGRHFVYRPVMDRKGFIDERLKTVAACLKRNFGTSL